MKLAFFITGLLVLNPAFSQIRLLPIGNSITWGVSDRVPPVGGEHGYRDHLYNTLVGNGVVFTGPRGAGFGTQFLGNPGSPSSPDAPYYGYYVNGAPIEKFLPDSTYDVVQMLDDLDPAGGGAGYPDIVLLHAGTNDMFQEQAVGDYLTPGTIVYELKLLMDALLAYTWNGGSDEIEQIFLAKIIPRAPYSAHPGINAKILDYNTKLQDYWVNLGPYQDRVTLVNMYSPFYANQSQTPITYYNEDIDATHPNTTGYIAMARHWADYILDYLAVTQEDQFARAVVGPLDGTNNWMAANSIQISNIDPPLNESPAGGAIYSNSPSELQNWDQLALWNDSEDLNTAILRVHPNSSTDANTLSGVGLLFGMSSTSITGNGYMAFVRNNTLRVFVMDTGEPNKEVGNATVNNLQPGDSLRITYTRTDGNNLFTFQRNNDPEVAITPDINLLTEGSHHYYTGIVFRGDGEDNAILVDWFRIRSRNVDRLPPGQISNLAVTTSTSTTISLQWTATGDNGNEPGTAAVYDLRFSRNPITSLNFNNATIVPNVPPPKLQGSLETLTVTGLLSGHRYYFAVKAMDLYGNPGLLSNVPSEETSTEGQLVDSLATLKNWIYDPAEYGSVAGEMTNLLNDPGEWGTMAVYKGRGNPTLAKLVWGGQSQNPPATPSDVENGGFVLLASDTSTTAHGYFLFVRTQKRLIYLWDIEFGVIDDFVKVVEYDYAAVGRNPGPGDTLTVIIDLPDGTPPKFDLYVNDRLASKISIYDERPENERPPIGNKQYAGVILSRQQTVRNNNIESFIVSGETSGAAGFAAEDYAPFTGTVDQWLSNSLEVCKVRVQDDNFVPLAGVPVFFNVKSGGGMINRPYTTDNNLRFEAEWGRPVAPMVEYEDAVNASNGKYVASVQQGGDIRGYVTFSFNALQTGPHYIWGRVRNINYPQFRYVLAVELVDYSPEGGITWEILDHLRPTTTTNTFQWDRVNPGGQVNTPYEIPLIAGQRYTLRIWTAHRNVQLDKLLITSKLNYTPSGLEPDNIPKTDATGIASTAWKIGTVADELSTPQNEGLNRLEASLLNLTSVVTFEATGRAGSPAKMTKLTDNLDGASGDTLNLTVQLFDKFNNKAPNNTVQFGVILGDGWLVPGTSTGITDNIGKVTTQLVLGAQDTLFTVRAQYTSADTTLYQDMKAVVTTGSVSKLVSLTASRKFYINEVHPNHLQVKVTDDQNVPIPNIPVRFVVTQGNAHVGATAKYTNASGISADTLWIGRTSSIVKVEARTSRLSKVVIAGDSVFYKGEKLKLITQGSKLLYTNNPQSVNPIRMRVLNNLNQTIQDNPVTFVAEGGGFRFPNGSTVFVDTTDATGEASTHVVAGGIHGTFTGVIRVGADNGFYPLSDSPILLDYQVKSEANSLVKVEGDSATGIVGTMLPELLKVRMLKANGLPIGNQPVTFKMLTGGGSFDDEVAMPQKDILCDPNGYGWVVYWLGSESATDANPYNNRVVAYTKNVDDSISTVFYLSAKSSEADTIKAESALVFEQIVGQSRNMQVRVYDAQGNKVQNAAVKFTVLAGGGKLGAGTADSTVTVFTNSQGLASVLWTLGPKSGTLNNVLEARATNGPTDLRGSPILFRATAKPGPVSGSRSTLAATSPVHAVPDSICTISVRLLDSYGNPVPNKIVYIDVKGDKWDVWQKQTAPTDTLGKATSFLQSPTAGEKIISAIVSGDTLDQRVKVIFLANDATTLEFYSGGGDTANVGTVLQRPFVVQITDGFNPVEFGPVYFSILGNKGSIVEPQPVVSDSSGLAITT